MTTPSHGTTDLHRSAARPARGLGTRSPRLRGSPLRASPLRGGIVVGLALLLGACTLVPDWADPTSDSEVVAARKRIARGAADAAGDAPTSFPNLAGVPDRRPRAMTSAERSAIARDLEIDRIQGAVGAETNAPLAPDSTEAAPSTEVVPARPRQGSAVSDAAALEGAPPPPPPPHTGRGELVGHIYFPYGSATIGDKDRALLRRILARHRSRGGSIRVVGHASGQFGVSDPLRRNLDNFEVSLRRANVVASEIMSLGVLRDRILIEAVGDREPLEIESARGGRAGNRRAEIFLEN